MREWFSFTIWWMDQWVVGIVEDWWEESLFIVVVVVVVAVVVLKMDKSENNKTWIKWSGVFPALMEIWHDEMRWVFIDEFEIMCRMYYHYLAGCVSWGRNRRFWEVSFPRLFHLCCDDYRLSVVVMPRWFMGFLSKLYLRFLPTSFSQSWLDIV